MGSNFLSHPFPKDFPNQLLLYIKKICYISLLDIHICTKLHDQYHTNFLSISNIFPFLFSTNCSIKIYNNYNIRLTNIKQISYPFGLFPRFFLFCCFFCTIYYSIFSAPILGIFSVAAMPLSLGHWQARICTHAWCMIMTG